MVSAAVQVHDHVLNGCAQMNLKHRGEIIYHEVKTPDGQATHAWIPVRKLSGYSWSTMEELAAHLCSKLHGGEDMHRLWLSVRNRIITDKLQSCTDPRFPEVETDRDWMAFRDGLYHISHDSFVEFQAVPADLIACNYHDMPFTPVNVDVDTDFEIDDAVLHLATIATPVVDKIMATQEFDNRTRFWLLAMLGRLQ